MARLCHVDEGLEVQIWLRERREATQPGFESVTSRTLIVFVQGSESLAELGLGVFPHWMDGSWSPLSPGRN
jgi:hypothetical protein